MAAPLFVCTKEEQRSVIRFLWSEGVKGAEIYRRLSSQYGDNVLPQRSVYEWMEQFRNGRTSVTHEQGAGRPSTSTADDNIDKVRDMILNNRRITIDEVATSSIENEGDNEGDSFLNRIVTGDETWIHYYEPESKRQSMEWKHPESPAKKKFKVQPSAGKLMLTVFWDSKGPIIEHYQEQGSTVNSARYSEMLCNHLRPAIRSKRRGLLSKGVLLLHDNARPHTAAHTVETLQRLNFEVLDHPPYSPDLAPSDFHLFGPLKDALRGHRFLTDQSVKDAVHSWLVSQSKTFYSEGIRKLVKRWDICIEKRGDYIEK